MKHSTYQTLYQAHLGHVDAEALGRVRAEETDPFLHNLIDLILEKRPIRVEWDVTPFTDAFRTSSPRQRLDETVFAFLLRLVAINKEERYLRTFQKPESQDAVMAWDALLRSLVTCTLALLYGVRWTAEQLLGHLEPAVFRLLSGSDASALRQLMQGVGIVLAQDEPYQAERHFEKLNFLHVGQYSAFYWRYLHWMAEAYTASRDVPELAFYRRQWLDLINQSLYRTLRCGICMFHFRAMLKEVQPQLLTSDFPRLWFDLHNRVHAQRREQYPFLKEPDYTESEYAEDAEFMRQALSP